MLRTLSTNNLSTNRPSRFFVQYKRRDELIIDQKHLDRHIVKRTLAVRWIWEILDKTQCPLFNNMLTVRAKQAKFVRELHLEFFDLSNKEMRWISRSLKEFCALKNFSLKMSYCYRITDTGIFSLSKALKKLSGLESLAFCFSGFSSVTNKSLKILTKSFRMHIFSLKNIRLCLYHYYGISDFAIPGLSKGLKRLGYLQKFTLEVAPGNWITNEGILNLKKLIQELRTLKEVDIYVEYHPEISLYKEGTIIQNFETFSSLQNITIDFDASRSLINLGFRHLAQGLESLTIFFDIGSPVHTMQSGFDILSKFPALKSLFLQFNTVWRFDDFQMKSLGQSLENLTSLESVNFKFLICPGMTDDGLEPFSQSLSSLTKVQSLDIEFLTCFWLTDKGLKYLCKSLEGRFALRNLRLHFRSCNRITDEGIYFLRKSVERLVYLQSAYFDFSDVPELSDSGIQSFIKSLKKHVALKEVTFWV